MGGNQYLGVTHSPLHENPDLDCVDVRLDRQAHLYDVRMGNYLGNVDRIETRIPAGGAGFYALLRYRVSELRVNASAEGQKAESGIACELRTARGQLGDHVVHVRVRGPDGTWAPAYERNVLAHKGRVAFSVPFALSDPVGEWTIVCRDVASGVEGRATILRKP